MFTCDAPALAGGGKNTFPVLLPASHIGTGSEDDPTSVNLGVGNAPALVGPSLALVECLRIGLGPVLGTGSEDDRTSVNQIFSELFKKLKH